MNEPPITYRWPCSIPCRCDGKRRALTGRIVDLSVDGALIALSSGVLPAGSRVVLTLRGERSDISLDAKVVFLQRRSGGPIGVEFCDTCDQNLEKLSPFLQAFEQHKTAEPVAAH